MSFARIGSLGTASSKTAGQTLSLNPSSSVPAGHLVAVYVGWAGDELYTDGGVRQDLGLACTDDQGNIYTELQSGLYDVSCSLFLAYIDNPLSTSSTITITHRSSLLVAKGMSVEEFSIGAGKRFAVWRDVMNAFEQTSYFSPFVTGLDSGTEYLLLNVLATLRPTTDSYTWDSDYTQIAVAGTTGGTDSSNVTLRGSSRIVSGVTTDTCSLSNTTAATAVDIMQAMVVVSEINYDASFPTFPNFDDFNRADEDPLSNPPWDDDPNHHPGQGSAQCRVVSNECARSASGTFHGAQFWLSSIPAGDDGEVFTTITNVGASTSRQGAHCFASGSGHNATLGGYAVYWIGETGARPDHLDYGSSGNTGGGVTQGLIVWADKSSPCKMGLQLRSNGRVLQLWADTGSGWRWVSAYYVTGGGYANSGYFGLNFANDSAARMDDFGGGTSLPPFLPQIIRRLSVH